jgi:hypothetical protein
MDMSFSLWMFNEWVNRALHGYRPNVLAIDKVGVVLIIFCPGSPALPDE